MRQNEKGELEVTVTQEEMLNNLVHRYPELEKTKADILAAYELLCHTYKNGGKLLISGNGGSAADSEHIVGELMKGFVKDRKLDSAFIEKLKEIDLELGEHLARKLQGALPTISLVGHPALSTAYLNDVDPVMGFAQQVNGLGNQNDTLLVITTSGNSKNIIYAVIVAKAKGMKVIGLTGKDGGRLKQYVDVSIIVDEQETYHIQELHLPIYHTLCLMLEEEFF